MRLPPINLVVMTLPAWQSSVMTCGRDCGGPFIEDIWVGVTHAANGDIHVDACWHDGCDEWDVCPSCIGRAVRELVDDECSGIYLDEDTPLACEVRAQVFEISSDELAEGITLFTTSN